MLMKRFKMRPTTECFNLAGMGCATGVSGVELAANIMHSNPKKGYTLLVLHENLTSSLYTGKNKSYLLSNVLFRLGASALLLTDHESERGRAKYELQHVVRTVIADDDEAYNCMTLQLDEDNKMGIYLPPLKSLGEIAGRAIKKTMARLGEHDQLAQVQFDALPHCDQNIPKGDSHVRKACQFCRSSYSAPQ